ncbi:MAG: hypothetical protein Hyperionvirus9_81 [Hyperionvirus sp.]|uniref:Uncharacterized protein n=1 Tax=Hyperionvirus sp. TaxID=2487770 RepID=A0A3G5AAQ3_9VIRU|nr:MAG: hypothetical protein Hyperionvirus9_81 [Hyperionvirus sp.]
MRANGKSEIKELGVMGQKFIEDNKERLHQCVGKVFTNKNLSRRLDLINWPVGKQKDRSLEAIKTLTYLFNKLYLTFANCTEAKLLCLYCDAIEKYQMLFRLAQGACFNVESLEILKVVMDNLDVIHGLGICKCERHYVPPAVENELEDLDQMSKISGLSNITDKSRVSQFSQMSSTGVDPNSSFANMIPLIKHIMERIDSVQKYVDSEGVVQNEVPLGATPHVRLILQSLNKLCCCMVCNKILNETGPILNNQPNSVLISLESQVNKEMISVICLDCADIKNPRS